MKTVIIGAGVAGVQAALSCRRCGARAVALIDAEAESGYFRTLLPQFMVRTLAERKLFFWKPQDDPQIMLLAGRRATGLDRVAQRLHLQTGETLDYDRLIIASGGRPLVPAAVNLTAQGIFPIRDLTTARRIQQWLPGHPEVVVLGGGLVGVKTAVHLARPDLTVTLIERERQLLPQALSAAASARVRAHLEKKGIRVITEHSVDKMQVQDGELRAVRVADARLRCTTLLVAAGSVPDVGFLQDSGLLDNGELVVDTALQTKDSKIFAAGDAVTIRHDGNFTPWTWPQAVVQGRLAGANSSAQTLGHLECLTRVNSMNLNGLSLVVLGAPVAGAQVVACTGSQEGVYRELFVAGNRIVGGALVGDISGAGPLHAAMTAGAAVDVHGVDLLRPRLRVFG